MPDKFPQMIYHIACDPIVVKNAIELQKHLSQGWSMVPIDQTEEGMIQSKIDWHLSEAKRLQKSLELIQGSKKTVEPQDEPLTDATQGKNRDRRHAGGKK